MFGIVRKKGTVEGETAEEAEGQGPLWRALADTKEETGDRVRKTMKTKKSTLFLFPKNIRFFCSWPFHMLFLLLCTLF